MIKALVFDLDDTLYYEKEYVYEGFRTVSEYLESKYHLDKSELYHKMIKILDKDGRGKIFNIICEEYGINEDIKSLVEVYRNTDPSLKLYTDSEEIISYAHHNNIKMGIITDGCAKVQWKKINALKLNSIVDKIIVTDDYGLEFWKPHERSYLEIAKYFNINPDECIYVGDNPVKDFIGARKCGYKTIRIIREKGDHIHKSLSDEYEADIKISSLLEIKKYIKGE